MPRNPDCGPGDRSPECLEAGGQRGVPDSGGADADLSIGRCPEGQRRDPVTGGCYEDSAPQRLNCGNANCVPPMVCVDREFGPNCENPDNSDDKGGGGSGGGGGNTPVFRSATTQFNFKPIDLTPYTNPNWTQINQVRDWWLKDPAYQQALRQVGSLYNAFGGGGAQAYGLANDYYSTLLQGGKGPTARFLAPMYSNLAGQTQQQLKSVQNNAALRGGARDAAVRDINTSAFQTGQGFITQAQPQAAQALGQLGVAGGQIGENAAQLYGQLTGAPFQAALSEDLSNRTLGAQLAMSNSQIGLGYANLNGDMIKTADTLALNKYISDNQIALGYYNTNTSNSLAQQQLALQQQQWQWQTATYFPMMMQMYQQQMAQQSKAQNSQKWASLLGSGMQALPFFSSLSRGGASTQPYNPMSQVYESIGLT